MNDELFAENDVHKYFSECTRKSKVSKTRIDNLFTNINQEFFTTFAY